MTHTDRLAARFSEARPRLHAIAHRMLGSIDDADDAVQNAWLRLAGADDEVRNLDGWLTTVVARECLNMLRSRRRHPARSLAETPTDAQPDSGADDPEVHAVIADAMGPALMILLETLAPAERVAFVLHDVFAMPFDEIASVIDRSPAATRQLASRARRRIRGTVQGTPSPEDHAEYTRQHRLVDAFIAALRGGDLAGLLAVLDPDVTLHDEHPGRATGSVTHLRGAHRVAAHAATYSWGGRFARPGLIDGTVGVVIGGRGHPLGALAFTFRQDRISHIEVIARPTHDHEIVPIDPAS